MIDLHTHTTYSDGTDNLITLLKNAEKSNIEVLSITDHVTCEGYNELKTLDVKQYFSGKIIKGCELYTSIEGQTVELLAYNIDTEIFNDKLPKIYQSESEDNKYQYEQLLQICKKLGVKINYDKIQINFDNEFCGDVIWKEIIKNSENKKFFDDVDSWQNSNTFYRRCMTNSKSKFFIDKSNFYPSISEVINLIKSAGGLVFIPHIYMYGDNSIKFFEIFTKNYPIDGIECYYNSFTNSQTQFLLNYCKENNLLISGGTDYHANNKPGIKLGIGRGNLNIPKSILKNWGTLEII
ncbi:MAG: PHP domain-containing protein [Clostridia bacterium]|nr:PHP domain-containing protein [Clostridia bacterium]